MHKAVLTAVQREVGAECVEDAHVRLLGVLLRKTAAALRHLAAAGHVVEGAAAVGHAAILSGRFRPEGPTVTILSGGNIDSGLHARIVAGANSVEAA